MTAEQLKRKRRRYMRLARWCFYQAFKIDMRLIHMGSYR